MLTKKTGRKATFVVTIGLLTAFGTQAANADESRDVFLRFAGDFIQNVEQFDAVDGVPTGPTSLTGLVRAKVKGNLGRADLTAVTKGAPLSEPETCPDPDHPGLFKVVNITANNLVLTFSDLSMLYGDATGFVCVDLSGQFPDFVVVEGNWLGGMGRFRNASGDFSIHIDEAVQVSASTQLTAETGTIMGTISVGD